MKKIAFIISSALLLPLLSFGQSYMDAIRYSQHMAGGTARSEAMGGAFGALGGDFSSLSINPGGIGVYQGDEFLISPAYGVIASKSTLSGTRTEDFKYNLNISNLGYLGTYQTGNKSGLINLNYAIGFNRLVNFNANYIMNGTNNQSSLADWFVNTAGTGHPEYYEELAYDANVINYDFDENVYLHDFVGDIKQRKTLATSGGINEYTFSFGANINHMVYLGATMGVQSVRYKETSEHYEEMLTPETTLPDYQASWFKFRDELETRGAGYNLKLGAIFRPIDLVRIGGAIHLPTYYRLKDYYYTSMQSEMTKGSIYNPIRSDGRQLDDLIYDYDLVSPVLASGVPFKAVGSIAFKYKKIGLVSVDYEMVDYSTMRLRNGGGNYNFAAENDEIADKMKAAHNLRAGAEARLANFYFRAGYALYGSPYKNSEINKNAGYSIYSGGLGVHINNNYIDIAYRLRGQSYYYYLYTLSDEYINTYNLNASANPQAHLKSNSSEIIVTWGVRF